MALEPSQRSGPFPGGFLREFATFRPMRRDFVGFFSIGVVGGCCRRHGALSLTMESSSS